MSNIQQSNAFLVLEILILIAIIWIIFINIILPIKIYNTCKKIDEYLPKLNQKLYQTTNKPPKRYKLKTTKKAIPKSSIDERIDILKTIYNNTENY
ncbi:MAG: hypothetical protein J6M02_05740 [Clostridia bacterium]|nr:hypothetical protein [Clostridia bacterium]